MRRTADLAGLVAYLAAGLLLGVAVLLPALGPLGAVFDRDQGPYQTPDHSLPSGCGLSSESCEVQP